MAEYEKMGMLGEKVEYLNIFFFNQTPSVPSYQSYTRPKAGSPYGLF
jgi:hypothetical protein